MEEQEYPEIKVLKDIYQKHNVKIVVSNKDFLGGNTDYHAIEFTLGDETFNMFADDEQSDFQLNNPLLNLVVVLRELDYYTYSNDYLLWCTELKLDSVNTQILSYYRSLSAIYRDIEKIMGKIDPIFSDWDFEMNIGGIKFLRDS